MSTRPDPNPDDRALREAFRSGDPEALRALCAPHLDLLYSLCLRMTSNAAEAEDAAQDALIRALDRCHQYDPSRAFRPWLLRIATNVCRDRLRSVWWRRVLPFSSPLRSKAPDLEQRVTSGEREARLRDALARLPPKYREAVTLFHLEDLSYAEMSEITGSSVASLKQRVRRGLAMLRRDLEALYPELAPIRTQDG